MDKNLLVSALLLVSPLLFAADPDNGEALYNDIEIERTIKGEHYTNANCETCHQAEFYTRAERKVTSYAKLEAFVEGCNTNLDVGWFPEEVADVAAYLNRTYYKFPQQ